MDNCWDHFITGFTEVRNQPQVLCGWTYGAAARYMENLTDSKVGEKMASLLQKFIGAAFGATVPAPTSVLKYATTLIPLTFMSIVLLNIYIYICKSVEGVCLYIDFFLHFAFFIRFIQNYDDSRSFSFGICLSVSLFRYHLKKAGWIFTKLGIRNLRTPGYNIGYISFRNN